MLFFNLSSVNLYPTQNKTPPVTQPSLFCALSLLSPPPPALAVPPSLSHFFHFSWLGSWTLLLLHLLLVLLWMRLELPLPPHFTLLCVYAAWRLCRVRGLLKQTHLGCFPPPLGLVGVAWSSPEISGVVGRLVSRKVPLLSLRDAGFDCCIAKGDLVNEVVKENAKSSVLALNVLLLCFYFLFLSSSDLKCAKEMKHDWVKLARRRIWKRLMGLRDD